MSAISPPRRIQLADCIMGPGLAPSDLFNQTENTDAAKVQKGCAEGCLDANYQLPRRKRFDCEPTLLQSRSEDATLSSSQSSDTCASEDAEGIRKCKQFCVTRSHAHATSSDRPSSKQNKAAVHWVVRKLFPLSSNKNWLLHFKAKDSHKSMP